MPEKKLRVAHVLGSLNRGGLQVRVLNLIRELPSFSHVVIFQSVGKGPLYSQYASVGEMQQCVYHRGRTIDFFRRLTRLLRETEPDVVLAHLFGNHTLVSWAAFLARVPTTYGVSANDPIFFSRSLWKPLMLAHGARPFCRGEIAVSHSVGRILTSRLHLPARRVNVIPNGFPVEEIAARAAAGRKAAQRTGNGIPRILMAAAMAPSKDQHTVLRAIQLLRSQGREVELWLAGGAFRESRLARVESLTDELAIRDLVRILGVREDVPELMGASDVVVHAAHSEGFGNVVAEAMAAGVPVVATDIPACREVLDGGRCGLLVPRGDSQALAEAIQKILDDEALRLQLVEAASERVRRNTTSSTWRPTMPSCCDPRRKADQDPSDLKLRLFSIRTVHALRCARTWDRRLRGRERAHETERLSRERSTGMVLWKRRPQVVKDRRRTRAESLGFLPVAL